VREKLDYNVSTKRQDRRPDVYSWLPDFKNTTRRRRIDNILSEHQPAKRVITPTMAYTWLMYLNVPQRGASFSPFEQWGTSSSSTTCTLRLVSGTFNFHTPAADPSLPALVGSLICTQMRESPGSETRARETIDLH
jgi:hypothetical protein